MTRLDILAELLLQALALPDPGPPPPKPTKPRRVRNVHKGGK